MTLPPPLDPQEASALDPEAANLVWHFGGAVFDERVLELQVGGELAQLERKPIELLRHLLRRAGEVVTRDELLEAVWPGRVAGETSLAKAVSRVRQALGDAGQDIIRTVHGYGYRLVAEVRIERPDASLAAEQAPSRFEFHPGMAVPGRPLWELVERLGEGGQGEVWLAAQPKSGEQRVLKFAVNAAGLVALKREITLYRFLRQTVGDDARCVRLIDWNLATEPFFLESEYIAGGSLVAWAAAQGGWPEVPVPLRLELLAQAADALAVAHGVGVLHRDVKPANLLIALAADGAPSVRMADFGSGGLLEPSSLDRLGITRMGLTQHLAGASDSGTLLYRAPEVLAGQLHTVRGDIYALGVMLYQLLLGDTQRPLAPGWEADIADPLLREDIALASAGNPALRLADAAEFAKRLRTLPERQAIRQQDQARFAAEAAALAAAEQARQQNEKLQARRFWLRATVAVLGMGIAASLWLYGQASRARDQAVAAQQQALAAAATSEAVTSYFTDDLQAVIATHDFDARAMTIEQLYGKLAERAQTRLKDQPEVEARVHTVLGYVLAVLSGQKGQSAAEYQKALHKVLQIAELDPPKAFQTLYQIMYGESNGALPEEDIRKLQAFVDDIAHRFDGSPQVPHHDLISVQAQLAMHIGTLRDDSQGALARLDALQKGAALAADNAALVAFYRAKLLPLRGQPQAAVALYRALLADPAKASNWYDQFYPWNVEKELGQQLMELGAVDEAETLLASNLAVVNKTDLSDSVTALDARNLIARLRMAQGRPAEAVALLEPMRPLVRQLAGETWASAAPNVADKGSVLVDALLLAGQPAQALEASSESMAVMRLALDRSGSASHSIFGPRVLLRHADALIANGNTEAAAQVLASLPSQVFERQPPQSLLRAERLRVEGALALARHDPALARDKLGQAEAMLVAVYTADSWRVRRVRERLKSI
ncbi:MAG TPA: winged helix-turn-helix domain-containing protein [Ideonella sp.]|uniref:protein kinase domain-containing protein n=1 Tax=Ideonella sp. TaxID=1929293 RepID=UPI002BF8DD4B|nr:winged helix-turn-helix domain-containing protein [Ideonella sp.]HSI51933.1 winged helix-turn-helix domain-containing protein [Ideonella sp.]